MNAAKARVQYKPKPQLSENTQMVNQMARKRKQQPKRPRLESLQSGPFAVSMTLFIGLTIQI